VGGGVHTGSTRHVGHWMAYCACPGWLWWWRNWWNENWHRKPKYSEKTCPNATLSTTSRTWPDPGWNPGRRGGKPATNRLSYGAALSHRTLHTYLKNKIPLQTRWQSYRLHAIYGLYVRYFVLNLGLDVQFVIWMSLTFSYVNQSRKRCCVTDKYEVADVQCCKTQFIISIDVLLFLWRDRNLMSLLTYTPTVMNLTSSFSSPILEYEKSMLILFAYVQSTGTVPELQLLVMIVDLWCATLSIL
jgi:hypothetical protein